MKINVELTSEGVLKSVMIEPEKFSERLALDKLLMSIQLLGCVIEK